MLQKQNFKVEAKFALTAKYGIFGLGKYWCASIHSKGDNDGYQLDK